MSSFNFSSGKISEWKSTGINNLSVNLNLKAIPDAQGLLPILENNGRMNLKFNGNYFEQTKVTLLSNVANIYVVYKLDPISSTRNTDYTIQNALFGAAKITTNTDISKNKYEGYGICFDEGGMFSEGSISNRRKVLIFGVHESSLIHSNNKANSIYVMGKRLCSRNQRHDIVCRQSIQSKFYSTKQKVCIKFTL